MSRILFLLLVALLPFSATMQASQETAARRSAVEPGHPQQVKRGDLVGNMQLLNLWGERPAAVQRLYEVAYQILAARPNATFADLACDAVLQRLCAEAGVTHFGGPMLGAVRPDGVAVWLRTLRPAKVEVLVTVDGQEKTFGPVESTEQSDLTAVVSVTDLKPALRYPYRVLVDGRADHGSRADDAGHRACCWTRQSPYRLRLLLSPLGPGQPMAGGGNLQT